MADIKISALPTLSHTAAAATDLVPIVDNANPGAQVTRAITLSELTNYLTNVLPPTNVQQGFQNIIVQGSTAGAYYKKYYTCTDAAPSTPYISDGWGPGPVGGSAAPWLDHYPTASDNVGNFIVWSVTGLLKADSSTLVTGTDWSNPVRETKGQVNWYSGTQPSGGSVQAGDVWFDTTSGHNNQAYRYNGTTWVNLSVPFLNLDTSGHALGIVQADGTTGNVAIVADQFEIVVPGSSTHNPGEAYTPFSITYNPATGKDQVYINDAVIPDLAAGKITTGTLTVAIQTNAADLQAGKLSNGMTIYNANDPSRTMPVTCYANIEDTSTVNITSGPDQPHGQENWYSNAVSFVGYRIGPTGFMVNRYGMPNGAMVFNYVFTAYADGTPTDLASVNINVMYQILDSSGNPVALRSDPEFGSIYSNQVRFPMADLAAGGNLLQQSGSIVFPTATGWPNNNINLLDGYHTIVFGYRVASNGYARLTYTNLAVNGCNI